jgi:hypothetical protein
VKWVGGMHWSESSRAWLGFFRTLTDGRVLCRHEMTWLRATPENAARDIKAFCRERTIALSFVVAQPALFPTKQSRGETVSETFSRNGVPMVKGDSDRINGWSRMRSWLHPKPMADGTESPSLLIHADCTYLLRTLPVLVMNSDNPDDVDETPEEFPANGVRYFVMSRPMPNKTTPAELPEGAIGHELRSLRAELSTY